MVERQTMNCEGPECMRDAVAKKLCLAHYKQQWKGQELRPLGSKKGGSEPRSAEERFWEKVDKNNQDCCPWMWTGARTAGGHGSFAVISKHRSQDSVFTAPHRFLYELFNGPIPEGLDVDHECHNHAANLGLCNGGPACLHRLCVTPEHLVAKSRRENLLASPLVRWFQEKAN